MSDSAPVEGDGRITITLPDGEDEKMDDGVLKQLMTNTLGNINAASDSLRFAHANASSVIEHASARNFDELGTLESRANSGVMATDMGGPTNAGRQ